MSEFDFDPDAIRKRIESFNKEGFDARDIAKLAFEDAPALLERFEALGGSPHIDAKHWRQLQEARAETRRLRKAAERVEVTSLDEWEVLPAGTVVLWADDYGESLARKPAPSEYPHAAPGFWERIGSELGTCFESICDDARGPIIVIYTPEALTTPPVRASTIPKDPTQ